MRILNYLFVGEKPFLKICKHCGKAFIANNPKTEYDTYNCKNQENVYKSRAKLSSNVIRTKDGIVVKNTISQELSDKLIKGLNNKNKF